MDGDRDRLERLGKIINERKQALVDGGRAENLGVHEDEKLDNASGDLRQTIAPTLAYHDLEVADIDWLIAWILDHAMKALKRGFPPPGVVIGTWLDGLQTGLLLAQLRAEDAEVTA